jgi:hypothetical protein
VFFSGLYKDSAGTNWPAVYKVPLAVGGVPKLVGYYPYTGGGGSLFEGGLVAEEDFVYWLVNDYSNANSVHLLRCPIAGCDSNPTVLGNVGGNASPTCLRMTNLAVFWNVGGTIFKVAK